MGLFSVVHVSLFASFCFLVKKSLFTIVNGVIPAFFLAVES